MTERVAELKLSDSLIQAFTTDGRVLSPLPSARVSGLVNEGDPHPLAQSPTYPLHYSVDE